MLLAFDSAARTGSFSAAAEELSLTQAAISRQVRVLEDLLDVQLFRRVNQRIHLTEPGKAYAREIRPALLRIQAASIALKMNLRSGLLNLAVLPTLGSRWLMPRFPTFLESNPDIIVKFVTKLSPFDTNAEDIHAAIHYGKADWPDADLTFLMRDEAVPVASPAFAQRFKIAEPNDLSRVPLLHLSSRFGAWRDWLYENDVAAPEKQSLIFEEFSITANAAAAGLGVALLPKFLIQNEIQREELLILFDLPVHSDSAYYLVIPSANYSYAPALKFKEWLLKVATQ
jgi:LysR family glycine cleavage system transcriptional activator